MQRGRADDHALRARRASASRDRLERCAARRRTARARRLAGRSARRCSSVRGSPARAPSRSTTCRQRAPRVHPRARRRQRIVVVDGLLVEVALREPHGAARRGCRSPGRGSRRAPASQTRAKLRSSASPSREDFSGWNCTPKTVPRADDRDEPLAVLAAPSTSASSAGRGDERVHVVEGRRRRQPGVSARGALEAHLVPADVRQLQPARRRAGRPSPRSSPRPSTPLVLRPSARTAAACRGRCRAPARRRRRARARARRGRARAGRAIAAREGAHAGHDEPVGRAHVASGRS